jgi:hypothetical protein
MALPLLLRLTSIFRKRSDNEIIAGDNVQEATGANNQTAGYDLQALRQSNLFVGLFESAFGSPRSEIPLSAFY